MADSTSILRAEHLSKVFTSAAGTIEVLKDINLEVSQGESLSIRGESGSGKSTLLNVVSGLETMDAGTLAWKRKSVAKGKVGGRPIEPIRAGFIGFVFQSYYLIPELNAFENILMAARLKGKVTSQIEGRARELLDRVGLAGREKQGTTQMSGGERQRIALARALVNSPELVLADEPTGNLDENTGEVVMGLLLDLCKQEHTSLVLVTHNPEFASQTESEYFLHSGVLEKRR